MQFSHPDKHCVLFKGKTYRVEVVRAESVMGIPEVILWLGDIHRKLPETADEAQVTRVALEILAQCDRQGTLHAIPEDPCCEEPQP